MRTSLPVDEAATHGDGIGRIALAAHSRERVGNDELGRHQAHGVAEHAAIRTKR